MSIAAVKALIVLFALAHGINPALATEICRLESDFDVAAVGDQGRAVGLYQFWPPLWGEMRAKMGLPTDADLRFDPRENIRTAMFTMSQDLGCRWSTWAIARRSMVNVGKLAPRESIVGARLRRIEYRYEGGEK